MGAPPRAAELEQGQAAFFADEDSDRWSDVVDTLVDDFGLVDCARGE
jgi:hypothetical protein